jgi:hypothetical protein
MACLKYLSSDHYIDIVLKVHSSVQPHCVLMCGDTVPSVCVLEIVQNKSSSLIRYFDNLLTQVQWNLHLTCIIYYDITSVYFSNNKWPYSDPTLLWKLTYSALRSPELTCIISFNPY